MCQEPSQYRCRCPRGCDPRYSAECVSSGWHARPCRDPRCCFSDSVAKARLEAILHPLVRKQRLVLAIETLAEGRDLLVDIPLLFESDASLGFDCIVTVACSPAIQTQRAMARGLASTQVEQIIASQWSNSQKIAQSDFVIWNDGSLRMLEAQALELVCRLELRREK